MNRPEMKNGGYTIGKMNSNNNAVVLKAEADTKTTGATGAHLKAEDPMAKEAKKIIASVTFVDTEGVLGTAGKKWKWVDALPAKLRPTNTDPKIRGFESQYTTKVLKAMKDGESSEVIKGVARQMIMERAQKSMEQASRAATPRSKTPAKSAAERAANLRAKAEKAEKAAKVEALQSKVEEIAKRLLPDWNSATAQRRGLAMGKAKRAVEELGEAATEENAYRLNKTRRAASRAKSAASRATNGNTASVVSTRRNYKKEISISDFCKEGLALQEKTTGTVTVRDVLDHFAAGRAAAKKATGSAKYQSLKALASKFTGNSNDE